MAKGDKDLKISIDTEADVSGIKKTTEAVEELAAAEKERADKAPGGGGGAPPAIVDPVATKEASDAVEDLTFKVKELSEAEEWAAEKQREADVEKAKNLKKQREEAEEAKKALDEVTNLQRVQLIQQFGEGLGRAAAFTRSLATELQGAGVKGAGLVNGLATGMESVSSAVSGAAAGFAVGGPLGAAIGGTVGLLSGPLKTAVTNTVNDLKALKQAEDDAATAAKNLKAAHDAVNTERQRNSLFEFFERGKQAITAAIAEYERFVKIRDATAGADTAVRNARSGAAVAAGGSPFQAGVSNLGAEFNDRITALENEIKDARARADLAEQAAVKAELDAKSAAINDATTQADVERLDAEAKAARQTADEAQKNSETAVLLAEQKLREVIAEKDAQVQESFADLGDEAAASGQRILDLVNAAKQGGQTLTEAQKAAVESLQQMLVDGNVAKEEQVRFQTELRTIITALGNQGKEAAEANALFGKVMESLEGNQRTYSEILRNTQRRQDEIEATLRELMEQSRNPPQPR